MDNNKVMLPRDVAEALEILTQRYGELAAYDLAQIHSLAPGINFCEVIDLYARNHPKEYFSAILNGYTIEQTPEEKVREYFLNLRIVSNDAGPESYKSDCEMRAVVKTLDLLEIKIEGVNA